VVSDNTGRQLLFAVGDHLFAAEARCVREIIETGLAATPIPGAIPAVWGLINLRGSLLVAGSLGALLELTPRPTDPVLVVFEHGSRRVALEVDRAVDVMSESHCEPALDDRPLADLATHPIVSEVGWFGDRSYFRLDMRQLFAHLLEEEEAAGDTEAGQSDGGAGQ
jgi:chemotaxis signal transduction protein